mgnify:CR=1 FL=1
MIEFWNFFKLHHRYVVKEAIKPVFALVTVVFVVGLVFGLSFLIISLPFPLFLISLFSLFAGLLVAIRVANIYETYKINKQQNSSIPRNTLK